MPNSKQIVYLSQTQYTELVTNGTITVDGVTVTYDENDIYVTPQAEPVTDVRIDGTSVAANGVADIPAANQGVLGVVSAGETYGYYGIAVDNGRLRTSPAENNNIKQGNNGYRPIVSTNQHKAVFYGLAKASSDTTQESSNNAVGTYTPEAKGAIQSMLGVSDLIATTENSLVASKAYAIGDVFTANGKLYKATAAIAMDAAIVLQNEGETVSGANATEIHIEGTFVKNTDYAAPGKPGVVQTNPYYGTTMINNNTIAVSEPGDERIKNADRTNLAITTSKQHIAAFYGLAKAAGDTTQSASSNAVGTYTDNAKASIKSMLGIVDGSTGTVDVSGAAPTIAAVENTRYVCGEVTSLDFTPPASGVCIVRFTSGSTPTLLTLPSTVKFPEWFDSTALETDTIYEMCITDGVYGAVMSWAL